MAQLPKGYARLGKQLFQLHAKATKNTTEWEKLPKEERQAWIRIGRVARKSTAIRNA